jgi:hypothetical protein
MCNHPVPLGEAGLPKARRRQEDLFDISSVRQKNKILQFDDEIPLRRGGEESP